jgi:hypothetical protein
MEFEMAFEFDFDEMFKACAMYLSKGLRVVRLHGIWPDGRCTCGNPECAVGKSGERSAGKHPVGTNWGERYARTEDDLLAWDDGIPFNAGCVLGVGSGVIDNENDTPEGAAYRQSLGIDRLETPSWTSGRSTHQMTLWDKCLESISKAEPGGLECRIGGGGSQIQSVMPPSWHYSGVRYAWKPGLSIEEVEVAETPKELLKQIVNYDGGGGSGGALTTRGGPLVFRDVHDGEGRHKALLYWAWNKIVNDRDPLKPERREVLTKEIQDANEKYIHPPKSTKEALQVINSCFEHYRRKYQEVSAEPSPTDLKEDSVRAEADQITADAKKQTAATGYTSHGLERMDVSGVEAYRPGDWSIQFVKGDPPEVILCVPAWENTPCRGRVQMTFDTFRSAAKVASTVFTATHRVILDGDAGKWHGIWKGIEASKKTGGQSIPGLMEQLVQRNNEEDNIYVGSSSLRYAQLAGYCIQVIKKATQPRNEEKPEPNESGRPCWVTPDELWLQWGKVWEDIGRMHDVAPGERNKLRMRLLDAMGAKDFDHRRHRFQSGRLEYVVFTKEWVAALEAMSAGDENEWTVKGEADQVFSKIENHSPSTVLATEVVEA